MRTAIVCGTFVLLLGAGCQKTTPILTGKGVPFTDSLYGTTMLRITDKSIDGYSGPGIENEYARADAENCDGTRIILRGQDGQWYVYRRSDYTTAGTLGDISSGEELEPRWDATDPDVFYHVWNSELRSFNVVTGTANTVHNFQDEFPACMYITTKTEGDASLDRRYWCFMVEDSAFNVVAVACYDRQLDSVVGSKAGFPDVINWASMDMSGSHCIVGYESSPAQAFTRDFGTMTQLPPGATGHMDVAWTLDSGDAMVFQSNTTDSITMVDLVTGAATPLVSIPFDVSTDIGLHFSGNCAATPGWVLVSTYGAENPPSGQAHSWMDNLLFMVELKADPRIVKVCRTGCYTGKNPQSNYFAEAYATVNRAGNRVCFGSNWGVYTQDYTDAYEVRLPTGWNQ